MTFCRVMHAGRLTKDPEVRTTQSGKKMLRAGIAWDSYGKEKSANFLDIIAFDRTAENIEKMCKKGTPVAMWGDLKMNQWTDKQTGQKRYKHEMIVASFVVNQPRQDGSGSNGGSSGGGWDSPTKHAEERDEGGHPTDDYPF